MGSAIAGNAPLPLDACTSMHQAQPNRRRCTYSLRRRVLTYGCYRGLPAAWAQHYAPPNHLLVLTLKGTRSMNIPQIGTFAGALIIASDVKHAGQGRRTLSNTLDNCCTPCLVAGRVSRAQDHYSGRKQPAYRRQRCQGGRSAARSCSAGGRSKRASGSAASRRSRAPLSHLCGGPTLACSTRPARSHSPVTPCGHVCICEAQGGRAPRHRPALAHKCPGPEAQTIARNCSTPAWEQTHGGGRGVLRVRKRRTGPRAPVPVGDCGPAAGGAAGQLNARRQAALRILPQPHAAAGARAAAARPAVSALGEPAVVAAAVAVVGSVAGAGAGAGAVVARAAAPGAGAGAAPAAVALAGDATQLRVPAGRVLRRPCAGHPRSASAHARMGGAHVCAPAGSRWEHDR